jgi:hypothetical protein
VKTITGWSAAGAAALTGGLAFGASRDSAATVKAAAPARTTSRSTQTPPDDAGLGAQGYGDPGYNGSGAPPSSGFTPPSASDAPPAAMSGGS